MKTREAATSRLSRKWLPLALGTIGCLILAGIGIWAYPSLLAYFKSKPSPKIADTTPKIADQPALQQPKPKSTPVIAPPPFSSAACKPERASLYDDFHKQDPGWNFTFSDSAHHADGQLVLKAEPNRPRLLSYLSLRYENVTICAHIKSPPQAKALDGVAAGGVIFWAKNYDNYYLAQIYLEAAMRFTDDSSAPGSI